MMFIVGVLQIVCVRKCSSKPHSIWIWYESKGWKRRRIPRSLGVMARLTYRMYTHIDSYWLKGCWIYSTSTKERHLVGRSKSSSIMLIAISASSYVSLVMICSEIGPNWEDKFNYGLARFRSRTLNFLIWRLTLDCCVSVYNSEIKWKQNIKNFSRVTVRNYFYQILTKKILKQKFLEFFSSLNSLLSEPSKQKISGKNKI